MITFTLAPHNPPTLSDAARKRLEGLRDEEIDYSDISEVSDDILNQALRWEREGFRMEWTGRKKPSQRDFEASYFLWTREVSEMGGRFENFWNIKASAYLHRYHPNIFDRYHTFNRKEAGSIPEWPNILKKLSGGLSRADWPWSLHEADTMGAVGVEIDPQTGTPDERRSVIVFGLIQPMEHLAFLGYLKRKEMTISVCLRERKVLLTPLPSGGVESEGDSSFYFIYGDDPISKSHAESLARNLGRTEDTSIQIMIPVLYDSWLTMRDSYDKSRPWKNFVRFDEVLQWQERSSLSRTIWLKTGEKAQISPHSIFSRSRNRTDTHTSENIGVRIEMPAFQVA